MKKVSKKVEKVLDLPPDVKETDLKSPKWDSKDAIGWQELKELGLGYYELTFYKTTSLGWVIPTLHISNAKAAGRENRTYAVQVSNGQVCRVGNGPHVVATVRVFLKKSNLGRLQKYIDLHTKGLVQAGTIRDRISTRRAQGQLYRQQGRSSWMW